MQAGCFLDKGNGIPEYMALRFLASLRKGANETTWIGAVHPNSIHLSRSLIFPVHSNRSNICIIVVRQHINTKCVIACVYCCHYVCIAVLL
jgi:hypothetical protein